MSVNRPTDVPNSPGVYEFSDGTGRVLYVGKAKSLAQRLANYFPGDVSTLHPRTRRMLGNATDVRWIVCASETEAFVLEREWVHAKQPPYNVRLRAGGGYGGIALSRGDVPRLTTWRAVRPAGVETFGPYPGARSSDLLDSLMLLFGVRTCDDGTYRKAAAQGRACMLGETGKCLAPCVARVDEATHRQAARDLAKNLLDPDPAFAASLEAEMVSYAAEGNFEAAARRRDQLEAFRTLGRRQRVATGGTDVDAVAVARSGERLAVVAVSVRDGVVREVDEYVATDDPDLDDRDVLETAVAQIGGTSTAVVSNDAAAAVSTVTAPAVTGTRAAKSEHERAVLSFAQTQASEVLVRGTWRSGDAVERDDAARRLATHLDAGQALRRIECTDISHTGGRYTVGAVVVLVDGEPRTDLYRRLHFGDGELGGDDYAATKELVHRRLRPGGMGHVELPDILLIDGGPGQVAAAAAGRDAAALESGPERDLGRVRIVGIAKRFEELWPEGAGVPLRLEPTDPALLLVQRARDEAHRYALGGNRRRREREALRSGLDDVKGLGPTRRTALLARFGTLDAVAAAPVEELAAVRGIGPALAERIRDALGGR